MKPAAEELQGFLADVEFSQPVCPIVQNVSVQPEQDPAVLKSQVLTRPTAGPLDSDHSIPGVSGL